MELKRKLLKLRSEKPEEEVQEILCVIDKYFPKLFRARPSIEWLHQYTTKGKESEWQAFFFEEYCRSLLTTFLGGWHGVRITKSSRIDYQRYYNWDLKVHSLKNKNGITQNTVLLNDKCSIDRIISNESGLGFIISCVAFSFDIKSIQQKWRDKFEKRTNPHSRRHHMMKISGNVNDLFAIFFKDLKMIKDAQNNGWIKIFKQGRQPTGAPRKPKYMICLNKIPSNMFIRLDKSLCTNI